MEDWTGKKEFLEHMESHPEATIQDKIKFLFQQEMGNGHAMGTEEDILHRLMEEKDSFLTPRQVDSRAGEDRIQALPLFEDLGNGWARINLQPLWDGDFSMDTLAKIVGWSSTSREGDLNRLGKRMKEWVNGRDTESAMYLNDEDRREVEAYLQAGCPIPSHSNKYRQVYHPHYRVIRKEVAHYFSLIQRMENHMRTSESVVVAIDGPCGSGKSTLGRLLLEIYDANLFHMDDYYLTSQQQTPQRYRQPGGNVDHERFQQQVLENISLGKDAWVQRYDCGKGVLEEGISVPYKPINIIEGSYSLRPNLHPYYHIKVFLTMDSVEQERRIRMRNGEEGWRQFQTKWIPLENDYFQQLNVKATADLVLTAFTDSWDYSKSENPEV